MSLFLIRNWFFFEFFICIYFKILCLSDSNGISHMHTQNDQMFLIYLKVKFSLKLVVVVIKNLSLGSHEPVANDCSCILQCNTTSRSCTLWNKRITEMEWESDETNTKKIFIGIENSTNQLVHSCIWISPMEYCPVCRSMKIPMRPLSLTNYWDSHW